MRLRHTALVPLVVFLTTVFSAQATLIRFIHVSSEPGTGSSDTEDPGRLHIGEIEAFLVGVTPSAGLDNANDIALSSASATALTLSGTAQHGADANLISGIQNSNASTWTRFTSPEPAIAQVDLGGTFDIETIRVWQRGPNLCCQNRLNNFTVNVYADDGSGGVGALVQSFSHPGQVADLGNATFVVVPEPTTALLMGMGCVGLLLRRRRK